MGSWPFVIEDHEITLRPLRYRDRAQWLKVRAVNAQWLAPWEATRPPLESDQPSPSYYEMVRYYNKEGRELRSISLGIWFREGGRERLVGQITLGGIVFGAYRGAHIGYWIDQRVANRGYTTRAVKALTNFAFNELHLHRTLVALGLATGLSLVLAHPARQKVSDPHSDNDQIDESGRHGMKQ